MVQKILLIDDEGISINDTLFYLKYYNNNLVIKEMRNCSDAIKALESEIFDLVILDIQLPPGDYDFNIDRADLRYGLDMLELIKKKYSEQKVLCFTIQPKETLGNIFDEKVSFICKTSSGAFEELIKYVKQS